MTTSELNLEERRRVTRHDIHGVAAMLPATVNVQIREVSLLGMLLDTQEPVAVGSVAQLRMTLSGEPLTVRVEVRRVTPKHSATRSGFEIGVQFMTISADQRQLIERFVRR
jgi:hypothetical protein